MKDSDQLELDREKKRWDQHPSLFAGHGRWMRFSDYEVTKDRRGDLHLAPTKGASLEWYRPFDYAPNILRDFLELADSLFTFGEDEIPEEEFDNRLQEMQKKNSGRILRFCRRYGLLGLFWNRAAWFDLANEKVSTAPSYMGGASGMVAYKRYARVFFPMQEPPRFNDMRRAFDVSVSNNKFLKSYSEPVQYIAYECSYLLHAAQFWQQFRDGGFEPEDEYEGSRISWAERLSSLIAAGPVGLRAVFDRVWQVDYMFNSLLSVLKIIFIMNVASEKQQVKLCALDDCRRPFIARVLHACYCSESCSNRSRQRKFQNKKRNKKSQVR